MKDGIKVFSGSKARKTSRGVRDDFKYLHFVHSATYSLAERFVEMRGAIQERDKNNDRDTSNTYSSIPESNFLGDSFA